MKQIFIVHVKNYSIHKKQNTLVFNKQIWQKVATNVPFEILKFIKRDNETDKNVLKYISRCGNLILCNEKFRINFYQIVIALGSFCIERDFFV